MSRKINLNDVYYPIIGDLLKRSISPWSAKIASGAREYSDFSQASLEEWHDFRNGIGMESMLPSESARVWWNEGTDITSARSTILGSLVTTAGSFGVAPVKIIDFRDETYGIGSNAIKRWNTGTSAWDDVGSVTSASVEDCEDAWNESTHGSITSSADTGDKKVGSASAKLLTTAAIATGNILATEAISSLDLTAKFYVQLWVKQSFTTHIDGYLQLLLDDSPSCASPVESLDIPAMKANTWTQVTLPLVNPGSDGSIISVGIKNTGGPLGDAWTIHIDDINAITVGQLSDPVDATVIKDGTAQYLVISSASSAVYSETGDDGSWSILDGCQGYLAPFANMLYSVDVDGSNFRYSALGNIDGTWTTKALTEDTGLVYRLFSAKLLADDTPTPYFSAQKGLWNIDTTNFWAYRQEVNYPPLDNAGRVGMYWNANIWVATGAGITKVAPSIATPVGPDKDDGLPSGYQGDVYDMIGVGTWIVYCVNGGSSDKSSIFKRNTNIGGNLQIYTSATNKPIACIHHSPSSLYTNGRLWFGEDTSIKYMMFPDTTSNPTQISTYQYVAASATQGLILPKFRKLAAIGKTALGVAAITKDCDANEYITLYHDINDTGSWTSFGTYKTSPRPTILTFNSGLGTAFYTIQFAVKLQRGGTNTNTPQLESLMFYYLPRPARISSWTFTVDCTGEDGQKLFTDFEAIYDTQTLVTFYPSGDTAKTSYNVAVTSMPERAWWEEQGGKEGSFQITLEEVFNG